MSQVMKTICIILFFLTSDVTMATNSVKEHYFIIEENVTILNISYLELHSVKSEEECAIKCSWNGNCYFALIRRSTMDCFTDIYRSSNPATVPLHGWAVLHNKG